MHLATGRTGEAEEALRRAIRLDATLPGAHRLLGNALVLRGHLSEAVEWWERWLELVPPVGNANGERDEVARAIRAARDLATVVKGTHV